MTYVEGRLASPRAKSRALSLLGLTAALSFSLGVARNLDLENAASASQATLSDGVPEAVAYNGPLTETPEATAPRARRARTVAAARPEAPLLQVAEAPAALAVSAPAVDAATVAPDEPLQPPPSV